MKIQKKYIIKIPSNVCLLYSAKSKILSFMGPQGVKTLQVPLKIVVLEAEKIIKITRIPFKTVSNNVKKRLKVIQGLLVAELKQILLDVIRVRVKKLKLEGLGYKLFHVEHSSTLIYFKLGYSHFVYCRVPSTIKLVSLKATKLFIFGSSHVLVSQIAALIKSYRIPDVYKGKGVLYVNERVRLKKGKKV